MTHRLPTLLCSGLLLLALAACYDNDPPTAEPQPRPGSATIVPDWGDAEGTAVRTLVMAYGQDGSLSPGSLSHENLTPGRHRAFAYTPAAQHLAVEGGIAGINAGAGDVLPSVGELWTGHADFDVEEDRETAVAQNNLQLPLGHRMSLVTVTLKKGDGYGQDEEMPTIDKVELLKTDGFQLEGTMELADGDVTATGSSTATSLTTYKYSSDYRAILLPGEVISNVEDFIRITLADGTTYTYKPETAITTTANTVYNFALELNKAGVDLSGLTIGKWGKTDTYEGGAGMEIPATQTPSN